MRLVRDASMLYEWEECDELDGVVLPDKSTLRVTRRGKARFRVNVDDETYWVELKNTCYAPTLCINLILLGTLMLQGCKLSDTSKGYAIVKDGSVVMNVQVTNNVPVVYLVTPGKE